MIEKKTIIEQIEIKPDGNVQVRLQLLTVEDGEVLVSAWHRTMIPPGVDVDKQMSFVNAHLGLMHKSPVGEECLARLRAHVAVAHTKEAIDAYTKARMEDTA